MVDTSFISNPTLPPVSNPLQTLSTIQGLKLQQAQTANAVQENQNLQTQNATGQQALAVARMTRQAQVTYGLSNLPDSQLAGGQPVRDALDAELKAGTIDQNTHDVALGNLPPPTQADGSPTPASAFRQSLNSHLIATLGGPQAVQAVTGTAITTDNGQVIQGAMQGGALGPTPGAINQSGQPVQKTTSPETNATISQIWNPATHSFVPVPRSSLPGASGITGNGGYSPVAPPQGTPQGGTAPIAPQGQPNPQTASGLPPGPIQTTAPMGTSETIAANQGQYQNDVKDIPDAQQRIANLQAAHDALARLASNAPGSLGVGADKIQQFKQIMTQLGVGGQTLDNVNDYATANKFFMQNAANLPSARSDASLSATLAGNPSTHLPPDAALDVTNQIIGRERERIAQVLEAPDKTGMGYQNHSANFANTNDRRAFAWDMYSPQEQQKIISSLKGNDLIKFQRSLGVATRLGLVNTPTQSAPASAPPSAPQPQAPQPQAPVNPLSAPAQPTNPLVYPQGA